jgi:hypothetical protein
MQIEFLYFEDCPSHEQTLERLRQVLREEEISPHIDIIQVETDDQAQQYRFVGSPTIRLDGTDIIPPSHEQYALACRAYTLEDGRISPLPSLNMIRQAVQSRKIQDESR